MKCNFDRIVDRRHTNCMKWDMLEKVYGNKDLISMWVADSDFKAPSFLVDRLKKRAEHGIFGYTMRPESFYQSIIDWIYKRHGWKIKKEWIVCTPGVVSGINWCILTYTKQGEKITIQPPVYHPFFSTVTNNNRILIKNTLINNEGYYTMDFDNLKNQIDETTKLFILCNPHNPVGRVWKKEELLELGRICIENNVMIISDEIHSDLILDDHKHIPIATLSPELEDSTITFMAPSKTFNVAGLQTSVAIIPNEGIRKQLIQFQTAIGVEMSNVFGIEAFEACYQNGEEWLEEQLKYLNDNANYFIDFVKDRLPKIKVNRLEGTYLLWVDCRELGVTEEALSDFFKKEVGVAVSEGPVFGDVGKGFMRFNLAIPRSYIEQMLLNFEKAYQKLNESYSKLFE